jgi:hypothetical protein
MPIVVWIFALLAAALHIVAFACESFLIERPRVHQGVFGLHFVPAVRLCAFGLGFHNLLTHAASPTPEPTDRLGQLASTCCGPAARQMASANALSPSGWVPVALTR